MASVSPWRPQSASDVIDAVIDHVAELVTVFDHSGVLLWVNDALERILGRVPEEWIGHHAVEFTHPDDLQLSLELLVGAKATGSGVKEPVVYRLSHADGSWVDMECIASNVELSSGELVLVVSGRPARELRPSTAIFEEVAGRVSSMFEEASIGMAQIGLDGSVLRANRQLGVMVGADPNELLGVAFLELVHPHDRHAFDGRTGTLFSDDGSQERQIRLIGSGPPAGPPGCSVDPQPAHTTAAASTHPTRSRDPDADASTVDRYVRLSTSLVHDHRGDPMYYALQVSDVTDLVLAEGALRDSESQLRTILEMADEGIVALDEDRRVVFVNQRLADMVGHEVHDMLGEQVSVLFAGVQLVAETAGRDNDASIRFETRLRRTDGSHFWVIVSSRSYRWSSTQRAGHVVMITDIDDLKSAGAELVHRSTHDALTGLANRPLLESTSAQGVGTRSQALIFIDLDGFKAINDSHGHAVGDEVLVAVAARLNTAVRRTDLVARLGGDEFVVLCRETPPADVEALARRIVRSFETALLTDSGHHVVGASAGLAMGALDVDLQTLLQRADAALYRAKRAGGNRVAIDDSADAVDNRLF